MERNSSIELLRIIAIMGVVILHYNNSGMGGAFYYVTEGSVNQYYLFFSESFFIYAVNLFIVISASYLSATNKRKAIKVAELLIQVISFRLVGYILPTIIIGERLSLKLIIECLLPANYFVILYLVIYILSPYINILIDSLSYKDFKKLICLLIFIFSIWTIIVDFLENILEKSINGLSTVGMFGSQYGLSVVNFTLIYFIGAYIRKMELKLSSLKAIALIVLIVFMIYISSIVECKLELEEIVTWNYNNPLIILLAAIIYLLFSNYHYNNKIINELAKAAFTCYLVHGYFINKVFIEEVVNKSVFVLMLHQIGVAMGIYILSYIVYKIYILCSRWFIRLITPMFDKISNSLNEISTF